MNTLQQPQSHTKNLILNFIKNLLPKKIYNAISSLLTPCCNVQMGELVVTCISTNIYSISVPVNGSFLSGSLATITIGNGDLNVSPSLEPIVNNTVVFNNIDITGLGGADTYSVQLLINYYVAATDTYAQLITHVAAPQDIVFPAC